MTQQPSSSAAKRTQVDAATSLGSSEHKQQPTVEEKKIQTSDGSNSTRRTNLPSNKPRTSTRNSRGRSLKYGVKGRSRKHKYLASSAPEQQTKPEVDSKTVTNNSQIVTTPGTNTQQVGGCTEQVDTVPKTTDKPSSQPAVIKQPGLDSGGSLRPSPVIPATPKWIDKVDGISPAEQEHIKSKTQTDVENPRKPSDYPTLVQIPSDPSKPQTPSEAKPPHGSQRKIAKRKKLVDKSVSATKAGTVKILSLTQTHVEETPQTNNGAQILIASTFAESLTDVNQQKQREAELKFRMNQAKTRLKNNQPINPPGSGKYRLVVAGTLDSKHSLEFGLDSHADISILPDRFLPKDFDTSKLTPWDGNISGAVSTLETKGTFTFPITLGDTTFNVNFLITSNDKLPYPLLGLDFWHATQLNVVDYAKGLVKLKHPDKEQFTTLNVVGACDTIPLRLGKTVKVPKKSSIYVVVEIPSNRLEENWLCERVFTTSGELNIPTSTSKRNNNQLLISISNWGKESVVIKEGALIAQATPVDAIKEGNEKPKEPKNWLSDYKKFQEEIKLYSVTVLAASSTNDSVQSYDEHRKDLHNKEDLEYANIGPQWSKPEEKHIRDFLKQWINGFAHNPLSPKAYKGPKFEINTGDAIPTKDNPRRNIPAKEQIIAQHIETMLKNEIIEKANSPWAAPVVLARKKDGTWRFCVDYRRLNQVTKKDSYPLPRIDDVVDALGGENAKVFSTLDVASGYWHIPIADHDKEKTAFTTNSGTYQFKVLPFGLTGAPGAFCRAMQSSLKDLLWKCALVYVDDIIVWSPDFQTHQRDLAAVFSRLIEHGFQLKLSKCSFFMNQVEYLGFIISEGRISVCKKKVEAIVNTEPPDELRALQRFLGMLVWYRRFIPDFAKVAAPLYELTTKYGTLKENWHIHEVGHPQNLAFEKLKQLLCEFPILRIPDFDKPFIITCDASGTGTGAVLNQEHDGFEHPVFYSSKTIKPEHRARHSYYNETMALVRALKEFHHYIAQTSFVVATDCRALSYWTTTSQIPAHVERHLNTISSYDITFVHRPGTQIPTPDYLSRAKKKPEDTQMEKHQKKPFEANELTIGARKFPISTSENPRTLTALPLKATSEEINQSNIGLETNNLWTAQKADTNVQYLIQFKLGKIKELETDVQYELERKTDKLVVIDNRLWKQANERFKNFRPYVPHGDLRKQIMKAFHNDVLAGHGGVTKTLQRIKSRFYWPGMTKEITQYVRKCPCNLNKAGKVTRHAPLNPVKIGKPFESWVIDHIVMPKSDLGHEYILTMIDRFTKMVELVPTKTKSMEEVVIHFKDRILLRWGVPQSVLADNAFKGDFKALCEENGIRLDHNLPYQHTTMGLVERTNRTINETLRNYVNAERTNWDEFVREIQFAINSGLASSHSYTPFKVGTTRDPAFPIERKLLQEPEASETQDKEATKERDNGGSLRPSPASTKSKDAKEKKVKKPVKILSQERAEEVKNDTADKVEDQDSEADFSEPSAETLQQHEEQVQETKETAKDNMQETRRKMTENYNSKKRIGKYKIGEWVSITKQVRDSKLAPQRLGPYKVTGFDKEKPTNLTLQFCGIPGTEIEQHQNNLLPWPALKDSDVNAKDFPIMQWNEPRFLRSKSLEAAVKMIRKHYNLKRNDPILMEHLIGKQISTVWPSQNNETFRGVIIAHEGNGTFFVDYPDLSSVDDEGDHIFPEKLLGRRAPKWKLLSKNPK